MAVVTEGVVFGRVGIAGKLLLRKKQKNKKNNC